MVRDGQNAGANGVVNRPNPRSARPKIVPAIPHALERRHQKLQQSQAAEVDSVPETLTTPTRQATPPVEASEAETQATAGEQDPPSDLNSQDVVNEPFPTDDVGQDTTSLDQVGVVEKQHMAELNVPSEDIRVEGEALTPPNDGVTQHQPLDPVADLPPSFLPAHHHSNPSVSTNGSLYFEPPPGSIAMPQPRVNGNDLIFGGYRDSESSSPLPGALLGFQNPLPGLHPQGPGPVPFYPAGLDPQAIAGFPLPFVSGPKGAVPPRDVYNSVPPHPNYARAYHPPNPRYQPLPRREEPQIQQRYPTGPPRINGYFPTMPEPPRPQYPGNNIHMPQPNLPSLPMSQQIDDAQSFRRQSNHFVPVIQDGNSSMAQYVHNQFGNREFADYIIQLSHSRYIFGSATFAAHGLILARSPKLRSLMRMPQGSYQGNQGYPRFLHIVASDKFLSHDVAFLKALMRLYAEPLPDRDFITTLPIPAGVNPTTAVDQEAMRFALAYAAAGYFLEVDEIITHALDLAAGVLAWDTVSSALAFALEGGLSPSFIQFEASTAGAEDKASNSSFDDKPDSPASVPTYGIYSDRMLHQVVGFLLHNCPQNFQLVTTAPQLYDLARLPATAEPKHASTPSESRFSQIRFGEMSLQDGHELSDPAMAVMSSVLLSLPFLLLKHIFDSHVLGARLGWARVAAVARSVVTEREARRQRAMVGHGGVAPLNAAEERLWRNVRWAERTESAEGTPLGLKLVRHALGVETPASGSSNKSVE